MNALTKPMRRFLGHVLCPCCGQRATPIALEQALRLANATAAVESTDLPRPGDAGDEFIAMLLQVGALCALPYMATQIFQMIGASPEVSPGDMTLPWEGIAQKLMATISHLTKWVFPMLALLRVLLFFLVVTAARSPATSPVSKPLRREFPFRNRALIALHHCERDGLIFDTMSGKSWSQDGKELTAAPALPLNTFVYGRLHRAHGRNWRRSQPNRE